MPAPFSPQPEQADPHHFYVRYIVIFTLASVMAGTIPMQGQADPVASPASAARSPQDYSRLLQMDVAPAIVPVPDSHGRARHNAKVPERYDVSKIGARHVDNGVNFYSLDKEIAMGREMAKEWESQSQILTDEDVNAYVNTLAQRLVRNSDAKVPFTVKVVASDEVNAFALPGGFFYVNSGLVLAADEEAELAGVMSHEIAHVAARHATRQMTRGNIVNLASIPLIFVGGGLGYAIRSAAGLGLPLTFLRFSRGFEEEADFLGLQYMYKTGYDPQAYVTFFEKLQAKEKKKPGTLSKAFSTHPQTPDRIKRTQQEIARILPARDQYVISTSEFDTVKARLAAIENRRKTIGPAKENQPSLRRSKKTEKTDKNGEGDRPTLQRRDDREKQ
jgi:predicted Zn-dependent protease